MHRYCIKGFLPGISPRFNVSIVQEFAHLIHPRRFFCWSSVLLALCFITACSDPPAPTAPNLPPNANAGPDQSVELGARVLLDASRSTDPEGDVLTFTWTASPDNPAAIATPEGPQLTFVPPTPGTYLFTLLASDGQTISSPDSVTVIVSGRLNRPPVAQAGPDLIFPLNAPVQLDGSASFDPEGDVLTYQWEVLSASSAIELADESTAIARFTAVASGEYRFRLTVNDGANSVSDEVTIIIESADNRPPVAQAGPDQEVSVGTQVTLDGSDSSDPEDAPLVYRWSIGQTPGPAPQLEGVDSPNPVFTPETAGDYVFALVVFDGENNSLQDLVTIRVTPATFNEVGAMIEIPAGPFEMGTDRGAEDEKPPHTVHLSLYWMDKFEVTAQAYQGCVTAGVCSPSRQAPGCTVGLEGLEDHPANCVTWAQAAAYCQWAGKRLPTEAEWEKAARGTDGRRFPWGEAFPAPQLLNYRSILGGTTPVGTYEAGVSFYGIHNMGGNVAEWTADFYSADYYANSQTQDPPGPATGTFRVGRGANWQIGVPVEALTATVRNRFNPETVANTIGFRCARSPAP